MAKRKPLRTLKGRSTSDSQGATAGTRQATIIIHPQSTSIPKRVRRAQQKHKRDHDVPPHGPTTTTLADRFHALPPELREHIFALLLVQPVKYDLQHLPACPLGNGTLPPDANIRPSSDWFGCVCDGAYSRHHTWDPRPTWQNPWRSKYAPPVRNEFLCSDCWDGRWRPRPFPEVGGDTPCLCARRRDLDVLLVCRRWHAEAGRVFYSRNRFAFEDARGCLGFFGGLRREWRDVVTSVSLVGCESGRHALDGDEDATESRKALSRVWCLLRTLPSLSKLTLSTHYLSDERILRPLLRLGPHRLKAVRFVERMPAVFLPKIAEHSQDGLRAPFIWPRLAHRILIRGGLAEQVGRVLKGQKIAWVRLGKDAKVEMLGRAIAWQQEALAEFRCAPDVSFLGLRRERGGYGNLLECYDVAEWERLWWRVGWQHAFLA